MKKLSFLVLTLVLLASCKPEHPSDYMSFSGKIENNKDSVLYINGGNYRKTITINEDGTFKDTLVIKRKGNHGIILGKKRSFVFLDNGFDLALHVDSDSFNREMKYEGKGSATSNFVSAQYSFSKSFGEPFEYFGLEKDAYYARLDSIEKGVARIAKEHSDADTLVLNQAKKFNTQFLSNMRNEKIYEVQRKKFLEVKVLRDRMAKGQPSPEFNDYLNYKGGKNNLSDYKGTYVYIDLWATWCKPCIAQFPAQKQLEKDYHGKNITFLGIATDDERTARSWDKAKKLWRDAVKKYDLGGVQLFAVDKEFAVGFSVSTIPRYILLDPEGVIVDNNAPRPSDPKLRKLFTELGI
ncbi:TlpA disulfide reductase family protein [Flavobacteriaceae bacterium S356]|uniref:TlpA disulfide reductase family protein n=1 Tax=Asprobacillus argus TaxID=3076534 RepID=A0ABU3LIY5_9FLAO|nr:TlpA disulfide reductase family protein [Flavobacteriaceae bacterium S356]